MLGVEGLTVRQRAEKLGFAGIAAKSKLRSELRITRQIFKAARPNTLIYCGCYKATKITLRFRPVPLNRRIQVLHSLPGLTSFIQPGRCGLHYYACHRQQLFQLLPNRMHPRSSSVSGLGGVGSRNFEVLVGDPSRFEGDKDGVGRKN